MKPATRGCIFTAKLEFCTGKNNGELNYVTSTQDTGLRVSLALWLFWQDKCIFLDSEVTFPSLPALIEHYYNHPLPHHGSLCLQRPYTNTWDQHSWPAGGQKLWGTFLTQNAQKRVTSVALCCLVICTFYREVMLMLFNQHMNCLSTGEARELKYEMLHLYLCWVCKNSSKQNISYLLLLMNAVDR